MNLEFTLPGNAKSTGTLYKVMCRGNHPRTYLVEKGKELKRLYAQIMRAKYQGKPTTESLQMEVKLYFGDRRKRDVDNFHKLIQDAGTGIIYEDDEQVQRIVVEKFYDKENPRSEVKITSHTITTVAPSNQGDFLCP